MPCLVKGGEGGKDEEEGLIDERWNVRKGREWDRNEGKEGTGRRVNMERNGDGNGEEGVNRRDEEGDTLDRGNRMPC